MLQTLLYYYERLHEVNVIIVFGENLQSKFVPHFSDGSNFEQNKYCL